MDMLFALWTLIVFASGLYLGGSYTCQLNRGALYREYRARRQAVDTYRRGIFSGKSSGADVLNAYAQGQSTVMEFNGFDPDNDNDPEDDGTRH
jgi:hypothetical protein